MAVNRRSVTLDTITSTVPSRAAVIGNPSDGFNGATIALPVWNWYATVDLVQETGREGIVLVPNEEHDRLRFSEPRELVETIRKEGPHGGLPLLKAALTQFFHYCDENGIDYDSSKSFSLSYDTNIPRQVGLAGSSAIITGCIQCLMKFYDLGDKQIPKPLQAQIALDAENKQMKIMAGLQDRVVQAYNLPIFMEFSKKAFAVNKGLFGNYTTIRPELLPNFFIVYSVLASEESGRVHGGFRARYDSGDREVVDAMEQFAEYARAARVSIESRDYTALSKLMDKNFDLRRKIVGDEAMGHTNLEMVQIARDNEACAKFTGSGGAIIGIYQNDRHFGRLQEAFDVNGYKILKVKTQEVVQ